MRKDVKITVMKMVRYDETHKLATTCREFNIRRKTLQRWRRARQEFDEKGRLQFYIQKEMATHYEKLQKMQIEYNILHFAYAYLQPTLKQKLEIADQLKGKYKTKQMCRVIGVNHATFYNHDRRSVKITKNQKRNEDLKTLIAEIHKSSDGRFGANKIFQKLKAQGIPCTLKKVTSLMEELNLKSKRRKTSVNEEKKKKTKPIYFYPGNLLKQNFNQPAPNLFWAGDVTQINIKRNKYYLCIVMELFSRKIIGYRVSTQNNTSLTINTFKDAYESRYRPCGLTFHSDQGSNYMSEEYRSLLWELRVKQSFSKRGTPFDNSAVEGFFSNMKQDDLNSRELEFFDDLINAIDEYIRYYNGYRPHQHLKGKTPNQVEKEYKESLIDEDEEDPF